MSSPLVMGLDTRSRAFHWVASGEVLKLPMVWGTARDTFGWIESEHEHLDLARADLFWASDDLFSSVDVEKHQVHVFCEEPLALQNGATTRKLALAAGAVYSGFISSQIGATWYWVDPAAWKKQVLGRGTPPNKSQKHKDWINAAVPLMPTFQSLVYPQERHEFAAQTDLYDAFCLMRYGLDVLTGGERV